jgi:Protein of unknown function (DUF2568)
VQGLRFSSAALAFSVELAMLGAFGYWGFRHDGAASLRWVLGLGAPVIAATTWGLLLAPRSRRRLRPRAVTALSFVLFELAALALYRSGARTPAIVLAVSGLASVLLSLATRP